jgi:tRNA(Ile)-lysidine synthase
MFALPAIPTTGAGRPLLVGFSGGLDSTVLLCSLALSIAHRQRGLRAVHVHHGLHPDADIWAADCQRLCDRLGIPLVIIRTDVRRDEGIGPEASARKARYAAFESLLGDGEVLVLAHHRDDQAETFLMRALRASGVDGLAAMPFWRALGRGWLWRPLLDVPRNALLTYARAHGLEWIDDGSNADTAMDRNFLRHHVLPLLRERWPDADAAFARSAALCGDAATLLGRDDAIALANMCRVEPRTLDVARLLEVDAPRRARVLRRWVASLGLPPLPAQGIARIESDLLHAAPDGHAQFEWAGASIRRWRSALHAGIPTKPWPEDWSTPWDGAQALELPDGGSLRLQGASNFAQSLLVRGRRGGERMTLPGRTHSHALKHVLQDLDVPPWRRDRLPLLFDAEGDLLAAGNVVLSASMATWLQANAAHLAHSPGSD